MGVVHNSITTVCIEGGPLVKFTWGAPQNMGKPKEITQKKQDEIKQLVLREVYRGALSFSLRALERVVI